VRLYVDGSEAASRSDTVETNSAGLRIANGNTISTSKGWTGGVDEFRVYLNPLTAQEVGILAGTATFEGNLAPVPTAGSPQQIIAGQSLTLSGSAADDALPDPPATLSYYWQQISGPGTAVFVDASNPNTSVMLPVLGDYYFRLVADDGELAAVTYVTHTATGDPTDFAAAEVNATSAELSWTDSLNETGYRIWMRVDGAGEWTLVVDDIPANTESYTVESLARGQTYNFRVEALDGHTARTGSVKSLTLGVGFVQQSASPHLVVIEAEDYTYIGTNGAADGWAPTSEFAGFSGSAAMQAGPDSGDSYTFDVPNTAPYLAYDIAFETPGTHYLFIRCREPDGSNGGDSLHAGLNGSLPGSAELIEKQIDDSGIGTSFGWAAKLRNGSRVSFDVPAAGTHTLYLWPREDGLIVDKLLVTTDVNYQPTGEEVVSHGQPQGDLTSLEFWRRHYWDTPGGTGDAADLSDPDSDGVSNLLEFALGADPVLLHSSGYLPTHERSGTEGTRTMEFSFRRRVGVASGTTETGYTVDGVTYTVEVSTTLLPDSWGTGSMYLEQDGTPVYNGDGTESVTVRLLSDPELSGTYFLRLKVE
jgi:hypothetical protein